MIRSHRIALDPTVQQRIALSKACGCARHAYNWALAEWNNQYAAGLKPTANKLKRQFNTLKNQLFPWMKDSPKDANQQPFANLGKAFRRFYRNQSGRPTFMKKGVHDSFYVSNDKFKLFGTIVRLPVIGEIRMTEALRITGKIMAGTVSREASRWFLSIQVDTKPVQLNPTEKSIGIDLGLKTAVVCSDGSTYDAPKPLKGSLKRLRRLSRQLSRKMKKSQNRKKSQRRLARLHAKIKYIRRDWAHKVTTKLINENQVICLEDLNVKGMMANRNLSRAISDVGMYEFRRQLVYKAQWYGREVRIIGRFLPTSTVCSNCGCRKDVLALSERIFHCTQCGVEIDRDLNAARNICTAGLAGDHACGPEGSGTNRKNGTKPCRVEAGTKSKVHSNVLTN